MPLNNTRASASTSGFKSAGGGGLYPFTQHTFTSPVIGRFGPTLAQVRTANPAIPSSFLDMQTQGLIRWTIPKTGPYNFVFAGGAGGQFWTNSALQTDNGHGAVGYVNNVQLTIGEIITLVTGHKGGNASEGMSYGGTAAAGGGGASWAMRSTGSTPIGVAGGAGGATNNQTNVGGTLVNRGSAAPHENGGNASGGVGGHNNYVNGNHEGGGGGGWNSAGYFGSGWWNGSNPPAEAHGQPISGNNIGGNNIGPDFAGGVGGFGGGGRGGYGSGQGGGGGGYTGGWSGVYTDPGYPTSRTGGQAGSGGIGYNLTYTGWNSGSGYIQVTFAG